MHSWRIVAVEYGPRMAVREKLQCRLCGMLWDSGWRRRVPICWAPQRRSPPHWEQWWADFQRRAAYDAQDRAKVLLAAQQEHQHHEAAQNGSNPAPRGGRWRWPGLDCVKLVRSLDRHGPGSAELDLARRVNHSIGT